MVIDAAEIRSLKSVNFKHGVITVMLKSSAAIDCTNGSDKFEPKEAEVIISIVDETSS